MLLKDLRLTGGGRVEGFQNVQYVLKEREKGEHPLGPSSKTDDLIRAVGGWLLDGVSANASIPCFLLSLTSPADRMGL